MHLNGNIERPAHHPPIGQSSPDNMQMSKRHFLSSWTPCFTAKRERGDGLRLHTQKKSTCNRDTVHSVTCYMWDERFAKLNMSCLIFHTM